MAKQPKTSAVLPKKTTPAQTSNLSAEPKITSEEIAKRAYEIYQARGGEHGLAEEDWYQAERELKLGTQ